MSAAPAVRPSQTSAERPAPRDAGEVFLRDFNGDGARRISLSLADRLVSDGIAERVSGAGHVRLKLGIRSVSDLAEIHGLPAVEESRRFRGDRVTASEMRYRDKSPGVRWEPPGTAA
jgi:hypothetical protein